MLRKLWHKVLVVALAGILMTGMPVQTSVFAKKMSEEELFVYSENGIYFYNPYGNNRCVDAGAENTFEIETGDVYISADDNASAIMGVLLNNGYTRESAAAILGNLYAESRLNPRILQGGAIVKESFRAWNGSGKTYNGGFGIVQWDYWSRVQGLQNYADGHGLPVATLQAQVGYMLIELAEYGYGPNNLNSMSLEDATYQIWRNYENPATLDYETRYGYATQFLDVEPTGLPERVAAGGNGEFVNCVIGDYDGYYSGNGTPVEVDGIISFLQCDPAWGNLNFGREGVGGSDGHTICEAGCGPTSFASIAATMGLSVDPVATADVAGRAGMYSYGRGSSWAITKMLAEYYGLEYEPLGSASVEHINSVLRSGGMVHVAGGGGMPYTEGGHYIAIVGIADSGDWIVVDSGHSAEYAVATYSPYQVVAGMHVGSAGVVRR